MRLDGVEVKVSLDSDQTAAAVQALDLADGAAARRRGGVLDARRHDVGDDFCAAGVPG
jgi:hypothetical protein